MPDATPRNVARARKWIKERKSRREHAAARLHHAECEQCRADRLALVEAAVKKGIHIALAPSTRALSSYELQSAHYEAARVLAELEGRGECLNAAVNS